MKLSFCSALVMACSVSVHMAMAADTSPVANPSGMSKGQYLSRLGDCAACHTAVKGALYAGGLSIESPLGTIYSSNITPDKATGIGNYSLDDFQKAVRHGIRQDGSSLYPAMPYPSYARMTDEDIAELYAYFMHEVPAVAAPNREVDISWPLSMRWPLAVWRKWFAPEPVAFSGAPFKDPQLARGAYIVEGPGHCGSCHTARGFALQELALSNAEGKAYLAGGAIIDGWSTPSLRGDERGGLGKWTEEDLVLFLKTGRTDHTAAFGGMSDVIAWSTQYASDYDLQAVARYLKSLPADGPSPALKPPTLAATELPGHAAYEANCALCHGSDGKGIARMFPPLAGNSIVISDQPQSLLKIMLDGAQLPPSHWAPSSVHMPGYRGQLQDQQIADIANYVRQAWGNDAAPIISGKDAAAVKAGATLQVGTTRSDIGWQTVSPQPYGPNWTFSMQAHERRDTPK
jgi:mono/diheme cytochrome c family protein